jgi:DNA-binding MarR family transcriptional regulator
VFGNYEQKPDASTVRLKYFLARRIELQREKKPLPKGTSMLAPLDAAILAAVAWMEEYSGTNPLNQQGIAKLLNTAPTVVSSKISKQLKGLVVKTDPKSSKRHAYYELTARGRETLTRFADDMLGTPKAVDPQITELLGPEVLAAYGQIIDGYLTNCYEAVRAEP